MIIFSIYFIILLLVALFFLYILDKKGCSEVVDINLMLDDVTHIVDLYTKCYKKEAYKKLYSSLDLYFKPFEGQGIYFLILDKYLAIKESTTIKNQKDKMIQALKLLRITNVFKTSN